MGGGECSTIRKSIVCTIHLIVRVIKFRRLRWAGHVARREECRSAFEISTDKPRVRRSFRIDN